MWRPFWFHQHHYWLRKQITKWLSLSKGLANNNLPGARRTQMKGRTPQVVEKDFLFNFNCQPSKHTTPFWRWHASTACTDQHDSHETAVSSTHSTHHSPSSAENNLNFRGNQWSLLQRQQHPATGHTGVMHIPAWSLGSVILPLKSRDNSHGHTCGRLSSVQEERPCHEPNNPALSGYKSNNAWPWHQRVSVFLKSAPHVSHRTRGLLRTVGKYDLRGQTEHCRSSHAVFGLVLLYTLKSMCPPLIRINHYITESAHQDSVPQAISGNFKLLRAQMIWKECYIVSIVTATNRRRAL